VVLVEPWCADFIEDVFGGIFAFDELAQPAVDDRKHIHRVEVTHWVFAEEVERDLVILLHVDVLNSQRAAAYCIGLIFSFFVTHTKCELVDQVSAHSELVIDYVFRLHRSDVVCSNLLNLL